MGDSNKGVDIARLVVRLAKPINENICNQIHYFYEKLNQMKSSSTEVHNKDMNKPWPVPQQREGLYGISSTSFIF
ncbi:MAG: hypothetical protein HC896_07765 [Bacteroidales bacterium]|nr:hypothetical protein [Bacteroidales bacterium]